MNLDYTEIENILKSGDFSKLKGLLENAVFDVKEFPYNFKTEDNKQELCKDLASLANSQGGFIIMGVSEKPELNSPHKRVDEVRGVNKLDINKQTYLQIANTYIYPRLSIEFECDAKLDGKEIFYIKVPPHQNDRPYLVDKKDGYFGYWIRSDEHGITVPTKQIHEHLAKGIQFENYLARIDEKLDVLIEKSLTEKDHVSDETYSIADYKKLL